MIVFISFSAVQINDISFFVEKGKCYSRLLQNFCFNTGIYLTIAVLSSNILLRTI